MKTVEQFFTSNSIGQYTIEYKVSRGLERFRKWLPENCDFVWPCSLARFATEAPLTYWNDEIVDKALSVLENDIHRTICAIAVREHDINNGIDNLLRISERKFWEDLLEVNKASDILRLAKDIHPDYLFITHHVFGNLLPLYWAAIKSKGVDAKFDLPSAMDTLKRSGADLLIGGYDDKVRNAIAHGQVYFQGLGIQYGDPKIKYELATYEFLDRYDLIWRVSVSLAIAFLLFLARNKEKITKKYPLSINRVLASSLVDRQEFEIKDCLVSELANRGKQYHILVRTRNLSRNAILMDCAHFAIRLYQLQETTFARILFDVNYDRKSISGLLAIDYVKLMELLQKNASYQRAGEFLESNLLWYDEPINILLFRTITGNLPHAIKHMYWKIVTQQGNSLNLLPPNTYKIKETKNASAGGIARLEVVAAFTNPSNALMTETVKKVCRKIVKQYSYRWIATNPSKLGKRTNAYLRPSYIWVRLYKRDGTKRWLGSSGWSGRELICEAEFIRGKLPPILVKRPDSIENGIRYQFSMKLPNSAH